MTEEVRYSHGSTESQNKNRVKYFRNIEGNIFDKIRHTDEDGNEYWMGRELATAIGYKDFRNFKGHIEKAQKLCIQNNAKTEDHFVEATEMVELGSGANRSVPSYS